MINQNPRLELIIGTMFSGKSTELIRRLNRYEAAGKTIQIFKPAKGDRYDDPLNVCSHDGAKKGVITISGVEQLYSQLDFGKQILGIEEIQFLESSILDVCEEFMSKGGIVVIAGLLKNFRDEYFKFKDKKADMSELVLRADDITYFNALCTYMDNGQRCNRDAARVQRYIDCQIAPYDSPEVLVGGKEAYSPRCREHYVKYTK